MTRLWQRMEREGRIVTRDWDLYDTRHVVYRPAKLTAAKLEAGYNRAYRDFYTWGAIGRAALAHGSVKHQAKHFFYAAGWKRFEAVWNMVIRARQLRRMTPLLEAVLARVTGATDHAHVTVADSGRVGDSRAGSQAIGRGEASLHGDRVNGAGVLYPAAHDA